MERSSLWPAPPARTDMRVLRCAIDRGVAVGCLLSLHACGRYIVRVSYDGHDQPYHRPRRYLLCHVPVASSSIHFRHQVLPLIPIDDLVGL